jgi:membrane protein
MSEVTSPQVPLEGASPKKRGRGVWTLLVNLYREMNNDHVSLIAAGVAFYGLLALFPGLVAVMAIAGLVADPNLVLDQIQGLSNVLPDDAARIIIDQATSVAGSESGGLGLAAIFGLLVALYSASRGVASIIEGLNLAFEVQEKRGLVRLYLTTIVLTLGIIVGLLLIVAIAAILPIVLAFIPGVSGFTETIVGLLRWPVVLLIVALGLAVLYRYGPSRGPVPWRWITPGAAAACALWLVGSILFAVYVTNFGSYNETFGTLGGVIVLLTWIWLSAFIILMGAELDSEIERQEVAPQKTT